MTRGQKIAQDKKNSELNKDLEGLNYEQENDQEEPQ